MLSKARCHKCTLMPPCKHYESVDQLVKDAPSVVREPEFKKIISPHKRDNLILMLKKQARA